MKKTPAFSIVIPTLNEEKYVTQLLKDLIQQTMTDFEVIVVDGQSQDKTVAKVETFASQLSLTVITAQKKHVSHQRNVGATVAQGEWIIFMDADNRLPNFFLEGIRYQLARSPKISIFTTWIKPDKETSFNTAIAKIINLGLELYQVTGKKAAIGALIGCHQRVFKKVRFDENQQVCEDFMFVRDATQKKFLFSVFRDPYFYFSFRRLRKEGTLKMVGSTAMTQLKYLQGRDFTKQNFGYVMNGGKYYDEKNLTLFQQLQYLLHHASQQQLEQAKKIINFLVNF